MRTLRFTHKNLYKLAACNSTLLSLAVAKNQTAWRKVIFNFMNIGKKCSKCKKRIAVLFLNKYENGKTVSEGLCLKCAKDLNIPGFEDMINNMGIPIDEIDQAIDDLDSMVEEMDDLFERGGAMSMPPMMQNLLGADDDDDVEDDYHDADYQQLDGTNDQPKQQKSALEQFSDHLENLSNHYGKNKGATLDDLEKLENFMIDAEKDRAQTERSQSGNPLSKRSDRDSVVQRPNAPKRIKYKYLDTYCTNLNEKAEQGKLDPSIGRDKEIARVVQILNRRTKNNPCLIGEPGVGKTAIAEGIAQRIVAGDVPAKLVDKQVYMLDLTGLVAGTQFRGQFEGRVKNLVDDIVKAGNIILVIDEVHSLVGAGDNAEGTMNAANILKPALSRGAIQIIGATTLTEYRKHIEKDAALERRFQTVKVAEPTIEEATEILLGIKDLYEKYHRVVVTDDMAKTIVVMSERYINNRYLPDKAIDLLDEACSCASLNNKDLDKYDRLHRDKVSTEKAIKHMELAQDIDYELHGEAKIKLAKIVQEIEDLRPLAVDQPITEKDIADVVELWTGIPANNITQSELAKLAGLQDKLSQKIIGQPQAVELVASAVRRTRVRLGKVKRPASFILVGPTGVGKTQLVKELGEALFDKTETIIRVDMSELMEKHSVSKLIGAPPGYVGHGDAGQLTEKVRNNPYSIVLFDEIEKAHADVMNIMLQILDDGHITDSQGRDISFENCVIMMTSNAGSDVSGGSVGFNKAANGQTDDKTMKALRDFLRPEFLARIDEIVTFNPLTKQDYTKIADLLLQDMKEAIKEYDILFSVTDETLNWLAEKSHGTKNGAREIRRQIRKNIEDPVATLVANRVQEPISLLSVVVDGDELKLEKA